MVHVPPSLIFFGSEVVTERSSSLILITSEAVTGRSNFCETTTIRE
jgi:hypothetical protein